MYVCMYVCMYLNTYNNYIYTKMSKKIHPNCMCKQKTYAGGFVT